MTLRQQTRLALLIALKLMLGARDMIENNQQELQLLTQEYYKCNKPTSNV